jgi:hypothetical protein
VFRRQLRLFRFALGLALPAAAQQPSAREILDRVETLLRGRTVQGEYEMTIVTPRWQRTLELRAWMERPRRSFVRILAPAKEKGIGSLRIGAPQAALVEIAGLLAAQAQLILVNGARVRRATLAQ